MFFCISALLLMIFMIYVNYTSAFSWTVVFCILVFSFIYFFIRISIIPLRRKYLSNKIRILRNKLAQNRRDLRDYFNEYKSKYIIANFIRDNAINILEFIGSVLIKNFIEDSMFESDSDEISEDSFTGIVFQGLLGSDGNNLIKNVMKSFVVKAPPMIDEFAISISKVSDVEARNKYEKIKKWGEGFGSSQGGLIEDIKNDIKNMFKSPEQLQLERNIRRAALQLSATFWSARQTSLAYKNEVQNAIISSGFNFLMMFFTAYFVGLIEYGRECDFNESICTNGQFSTCNRYGKFVEKENCLSQTCKDKYVCKPLVIDGLTEIGALENCNKSKKGSGLYWIKVPNLPVQKIACNNTLDDGGWHLAMVVSDDGQDTWTWENADLMTNFKLVGDVKYLNRDFKSVVFSNILFSDILFIHQPSGVWASYHNVSNGKMSLMEFLKAFENTCYSGQDGYSMSAGTLQANDKLCNTNLYINPRDHDGQKKCSTKSSRNDAYGFAWNTSYVGRCPFDNPGITGGMGPESTETQSREDKPAILLKKLQKNKRDRANITGVYFDSFHPLGFGFVLDLNSGRHKKGDNYLQVFVR